MLHWVNDTKVQQRLCKWGISLNCPPHCSLSMPLNRHYIGKKNWWISSRGPYANEHGGRSTLHSLFFSLSVGFVDLKVPLGPYMKRNAFIKTPKKVVLELFCLLRIVFISLMFSFQSNCSRWHYMLNSMQVKSFSRPLIQTNDNL